MATTLSHAEGLLVIRELQSRTPELNRKGHHPPESIILVAQTSGESHPALAARVLARASRELAQGHLLRGVYFCVAANVSRAVFDSRRELLRTLVGTLSQSSDGELVIVAPSNTGASERIALFELVEATLATAPHVTVRLTFERHTADQLGRSYRNSGHAWQPAEA